MKINFTECPFCGSRAYSFKERAVCSVCDCRWIVNNTNKLRDEYKGGLSNGEKSEQQKEST